MHSNEQDCLVGWENRSRRRMRASRISLTEKRYKPFYGVLIVITLSCLLIAMVFIAVVACAKLGYLPWIHKYLGCPSNQEWHSCGRACTPTCDDPYPSCPNQCVARCECPDELHGLPTALHDDTCIMLSQCFELSDEHRSNSSKGQNAQSTTSNPFTFTPISNFPEENFTKFIQKLWDLDYSRYSDSQLRLNLQRRTQASVMEDLCPDRLFNEIAIDFSQRSKSFQALVTILESAGYHAELKRQENMTKQTRLMIESFLDSFLIDNPLWEVADKFIHNLGILDERSTKQLLWDLWFKTYPRSSKYSVQDSSGFEHVFLGETTEGKVKGLYNWVQFYRLEQAGKLNYFGYYQAYRIPTSQMTFQTTVLETKFVMDGNLKQIGSLFIGTSPEFELAVYTTCILLYPDKDCNFTINNVPVTVKTWNANHVPGLQVGSAYPSM